jgi:hypothetical protein
MSKYLFVSFFILTITGCVSSGSNINTANIVSARVQIIQRSYKDNSIGKAYAPNRAGIFIFFNVRGANTEERTFYNVISRWSLE